MDDKKDNIISKETIKLTSYHEYEIQKNQSLKKNVLKNTVDWLKKFFGKKNKEKKILENVVDWLKKLLKIELFWIIIPIVSSMMYFIINGYYQIESAERFYLPGEYFNVPLSKVFLYLFLFLGIPILLLVMKMLFEKAEVNFESSSIKNIQISLKIMIILGIEYMLFILFYIKVLSEIETFYENSSLFFLFEIFFWAIHFFLIFSLLCKKIRLSYLNLLWSILFICILKDMSVGLIFSITTIILVEISLEKEDMIIIIIIVDCIMHVILFLYLIFGVPPKDYEIFYKDNKPKVIITTYEGKYLIMDCDYDKDKVEITNIYRKNYEFIEMTEAKGLQYIKSNKVPEIKNFGKNG